MIKLKYLGLLSGCGSQSFTAVEHAETVGLGLFALACARIHHHDARRLVIGQSSKIHVGNFSKRVVESALAFLAIELRVLRSVFIRDVKTAPSG